MHTRTWYKWLLVLTIAGVSCVTVQPRTDVGIEKTVTSEIDTNYTLIAKIAEKVDFITTDRLLNPYLITVRGEVVKYTPEGKEIARYNNFTLGNPTLIDATNPFQALLYYPEYMTIVTLDKMLNELSRYELFDLDVNIVNTLCFAADGNIWIYDPTTFLLKKIDRYGAVLQQSQDFTLLFDELPVPTFLLERNNFLYMNVPQQGILVFDVYGQYLKTIPVNDLAYFQVLDKQLIYYKNGTLNAFHLKTLDTRSLALPRKMQKEDRVSVEKNRLFIAGENGVECYVYRTVE